MKLRKQVNLLVISYYYAPTTAVGGKRFTFLSEILHGKYRQLHVLTVKKKYIAQKDDSLPLPGVIHRTGMYPPYPMERTNILKKIFIRLWVNYLCLVDPYSGWIFPAVIKGLRIIKKNKIDLIIATGPPFSPMVVGWLLSRITKTKLILDYRDPWTDCDRGFFKIFGREINRFLERLSIKHAKALVFCSQQMRDNFSKSLGKYTKATYHVIHNGFHKKDAITPLSLGQSKKNIIFAGNLYNNKNQKLAGNDPFRSRSVKPLVKPLLELLKENSITKENFSFHIFSRLKNGDRRLIEKYNIQDIIREHEPVPQEQLFKYLRGADLLMIIIEPAMKYSISYKFYDYLSVQRPILGIVPENSAMAEMMNQIDCGECANINSEESILSNLRTMFFQNKKYTFSGATDFYWYKIADKYMEVIDEVLTTDKNDRKFTRCSLSDLTKLCRRDRSCASAPSPYLRGKSKHQIKRSTS